MDVKIANGDPFKEVYGFVAWNEVLRFTSLLMGEVIDNHGTPDDFLGHPGNDNFVIITYSEKAKELQKALVDKFNEDVQQHYSFIDRERGKLVHGDDEKPLMTLSVGAVTNSDQRYSDIREITELAAEVRRRGGASEAGSIETAW
jgi:GGDEF domain-containing protein